ncbi:MAG: DnaJ domain-containing protein [Desulfofustis sp.]
MTLYLIIFLVLVVGLFWLILTNPAQKSATLVTRGGPFVLIAAGALLTLLQRGIIGVPLIILGISWLRRSRPVSPTGSSGSRSSTVRSANLEMELDHDSGDMDGTILTGPKEGTRLSSLNEDELLSFYADVCSDPDSAALLESYLDRCHPGWQERANRDNFNRGSSASGGEPKTREEAFQVLGLEPGASREDIHQAYRRLIKGVHPDSGGSAFLTAKINAAKDLLLG